MKKTLITAIAVSAITLSSTSALADARDEKIEKLEQQMQALMAEIKELKKGQDDINEQVSQKVTEKLADLSPAAGNSNVKITMKPSPKIESVDGKYSFQPFGRVHLDYTAFNDDKHNHPDNSDWRRARLGFKGKLDEDWKYKYEMDLADQSIAYKEVYLRYSGFDNTDLTVGHFKPFQGLNELNSSNYISLAERAAPINIFARAETTGAAVQTHGDIWSAHLGVFGQPAGSTSDSDDEDFSVAGRLTVAPVYEDGQLVHLGASASRRYDRNGGVAFATRGETGDGDSLISTGTISDAQEVDVYGLEAAGVFGGLHGQAEYFTMDVNRDNGMTDAEFNGWYAQAGYILTGETRPYKVSSGTFGRIKPNKPFNLDEGTWGAFEIVGRYSNTDLNDTGAGITGGELDVTTGGINWYINNHVRMMANYRQAESDANGVVANDEPSSFTLRSQFDF